MHEDARDIARELIDSRLIGRQETQTAFEVLEHSIEWIAVLEAELLYFVSRARLDHMAKQHALKWEEE